MRRATSQPRAQLAADGVGGLCGGQAHRFGAAGHPGQQQRPLEADDDERGQLGGPGGSRPAAWNRCCSCPCQAWNAARTASASGGDELAVSRATVASGQPSA